MYLAPVAFESVNWRAKLISKTSKWTFLPLAPTVLTLLVLATVLLSGSLYGTKPGLPPDDLVSFSAVAPIDVHVHLYKDDPAFGALLKRLNLRVLDIIVIDDRDPYGKGLEPQRSDTLKVVHVTAGRAVFCTTFSPYDFEDPGFAQRTIRQLDTDFSHGAVAVKIYKVMGMEMKSKAGKYVMPDDPAFEPIYQSIAAHNRTVVAHIAEPDSCWQPPNPASPDYSYYKQHPEEYAYLHPEWPSKAAILAARDHFLEENPKLRVVGAHLGSMETDVDEIAKRFDRYPNFAVDTAARIEYLMMQSRDKVRAFLIKYQDRVLYGTDLVIMPKDDTEKAVAEWNDTYARDWKFFATNQTFEVKGRKVRGLELPEPVLRKLYHDNAVRWFPGIVGGAGTRVIR
jgi:predicted TIM-barrel fold metal-dependent hydrolase